MSNYPRTKSLFVVLTAEGILANCSADNDGSDKYSTPSSNTDCASSCIETFVAENYPASICSDNQDLQCLCTKSNPSGLTIGEALLQCVLANCIGVSTEQLGQLYSICSDIPGALPETHSTLTATVEITSMSTDVPPGLTTDSVSPPTSTLPPSIPSPSSTDVASSIVVASSSLAASSSSYGTTLATSKTSVSSSRPSSTIVQTTPDPQTSSAPTALPQSKAKEGLSGGKVAGIVVGGVAAAFAVFGLLFLFCCIRKRRKSKGHSDQWLSSSGRVRNKRHSIPSSFFGSSPADPSAAAVASPVPYVPPAGGSQRRSFWRRSIKPEEIGVAVSPELAQKESPANSVHSQASASALLPDKPNWVSSRQAQPVQPTRSRNPERIASTGSTGTIIDEDFNGLGVTAPFAAAHSDSRNPPPPRFNLRPLQPHRPPRLMLTQSGRGLPSDPRAQMYAMERQQRATGYAAQPRIPLTPIYDNGNVTAPLHAWTASAPQARPQLPPGPMRDPRVRLAPPVEKQRSNSSVYDSNASLPPSEPRGHESFGNQPSLSRLSQRFSSQPPLRNSTVPNPAVRSSTASSTTTFEEEDDYYSSVPTAPPAALTASTTTSTKPTIRNLSSHQSRPITLSPVIESPNRNRYPQPKQPRYVAYPPVPRPASVARQAERLPLPRAGRYIDTLGPPSFTNATTPFPSHEGLNNDNVTISSGNGGGPSSSLDINPPSNSSVRLVPNEPTSVMTTDSFSSSAQGREAGRGRSTSPSEHSSALLARRRMARSAALKVEEETLQKKGREIEARQGARANVGYNPKSLQPQEQMLQQKQAQRERRAVDYEGGEWGGSEEGKENESEAMPMNNSRDGNERGPWQQNRNMAPRRGRDGNMVLRNGQ